jgi:hypothetical protein
MARHPSPPLSMPPIAIPAISSLALAVTLLSSPTACAKPKPSLANAATPKQNNSHHRHGPTGTYTEWNWPQVPLHKNGKQGYLGFEHAMIVEWEPSQSPGNGTISTTGP